jgi:hypothetical protein
MANYCACGLVLVDGSVFCNGCGTRVQGEFYSPSMLRIRYEFLYKTVYSTIKKFFVGCKVLKA